VLINKFAAFSDFTVEEGPPLKKKMEDIPLHKH